MEFSFEMCLLGMGIGVLVAWGAVSIGKSLGNTFYDVVEEHIKNRLNNK
jgi:hypothetical protein